jgi:hypothetical protein
MTAWQLFRSSAAAIIICLVVSAASAIGAEITASTGIGISNEFLRIRVNPGLEEAGRFAVDTTGGDPSRSADDNQVLIYGSREPWTSYTTVLIDGKPFVFGGPTSRRAGLNTSVGSVVRAPAVSGETVVCAVHFGDVEITQELGFARGPMTRVKDSVRIAYRVTNRGNASRTVGLRVLLDTMLGSNDGAPLRAGERAISTVTRLAGQEIPDYWQAFDSLSQPAVIAQGTLRADGLTPPDRLEMVDWGTLADAPWDFPFPGGADFTRRGEEEQDTAVALYWEPVTLEPGESRTYMTLYGVGGVSLSPAQLSLGLTAPAELDYQYADMKASPVVVYVENSGGFASRRTTCTLELPKGLRLEEDNATAELGLLKPGETRQLSWRIMPTGEETGLLRIAAAAASENLEPNRVEREITVNSPPQIELSLAAPEALSVTPDNRYSPNPFLVEATVINRGAQTGRNLVVVLSLPEGLKIADESETIKISEGLDAGESLSFIWSVRALGLPTGNLTFSVKANAAGARPVEARHMIDVPALIPEVSVYPASQTVPAATDGRPTLVPISVRLAPARDLLGCRLSMIYDDAVLEPLYISRGEAFVDEGRLLSPWSGGRIGEGRISGIGGERREAAPLNAPESALFTVVFAVKGLGETTISFEQITLLGADGSELEHRAVEGRVTVQEAKEPR